LEAARAAALLEAPDQPLLRPRGAAGVAVPDREEAGEGVQGEEGDALGPHGAEVGGAVVLRLGGHAEPGERVADREAELAPAARAGAAGVAGRAQLTQERR